MTKQEIIQEIKTKNLPFNTTIYKLKIIDGDTGNGENEYYLDKNERDSNCDVSDGYFFERSTITFKETAFSDVHPTIQQSLKSFGIQ